MTGLAFFLFAALARGCASCACPFLGGAKERGLLAVDSAGNFDQQAALAAMLDAKISNELATAIADATFVQNSYYNIANCSGAYALHTPPSDMGWAPDRNAAPPDAARFNGWIAGMGKAPGDRVYMSDLSVGNQWIRQTPSPFVDSQSRPAGSVTVPPATSHKLMVANFGRWDWLRMQRYLTVEDLRLSFLEARLSDDLTFQRVSTISFVAQISWSDVLSTLSCCT